MTANHFLVDFADHVDDRETALLLSDLCVEEHLEKEVAEFFGDSSIIGGLQGVEDFVGFFDEIGAKSGVSLLAVPGTAIGRAEARHERDEPFESGPNAARTSRFRFARAARGALRNLALGFARGHERFFK